MNAKVLRYFAGGNTAKGFYCLYDSNLRELDRVFILSGKSHVEKSRLIGELLADWIGKGFDLEVIHRPSDQDAVEGFIIRDLGFGIVDGDPPRNVGKHFVGDGWETIDLDVMEKNQNETEKIMEDKNQALVKAYECYAKALRIHDDWEKLYIDRMDFAKADDVAQSLIEKLFGETSKGCTGTARRRFLGTTTHQGSFDFVENITEGLTKRYLLKGRAGTGKSTLLKKIVAQAEKRGYDMEIYHCGFDPESLDMVLVRELGWAVFDSTAPHEYFPSRAGDEVIDMYELTIAPGTDELIAEEVAKVESKYREQMAKAQKFLAEAKQFQDQLDTIYRQQSDQSRLLEIYKDISNEITHLANNLEEH
ncbi:hypothetical protein MHB50_00220 [Siminovitchia sp. FSL H7-0308]|uniref:hypothetical protein n=1 Tax=unclassified Siminovitchia TaxID=2837530 RepID=UPI0030D3A3C1